MFFPLLHISTFLEKPVEKWKKDNGYVFGTSRVCYDDSADRRVMFVADFLYLAKEENF